MKKVVFFMVFMLLAGSVSAVPGFIVHQGYIEDSDGKPVSGNQSITIGIYSSPDGDDKLFEQAFDVEVKDGYYVIEVDDSALMPVFETDKDLYLEISIGAYKGTPRQKIGSVPYAFYSKYAYDAIGEIHPKSVWINGNKVIDENGKWVGSAFDWSNISGIPSGFADGKDNDTLGELACDANQIAKYNGNNWVCEDFTQTAYIGISPIEINGNNISLASNYVDGSAYDTRFIKRGEPITSEMIQDGTITGVDIANATISKEKLNQSGCNDGQILKYSSASGSWVCNTDLNTTYSAGNGLTLAGNTFSVNFAGTGSANTVARSDHNHDSVYAPLYHNHDDAYVNVKGDTMIGKLAINIDSNIETPIALTTSNGSILFEGPSGILPKKGRGIRFMWVPEKRAIRAGEAIDTEWDNVGNFSYAFGEGLSSTGDYNFASGMNITTMGMNNYAFGAKITTNGNYIFAAGRGINLLGSDLYAVGSDITAQNAIDINNSIAIGNNINVSSNNSITIGSGDPNSPIGGPLINNISNSIMLGTNSTLPTVFIEGGSGGSATGKVGIGNTDPAAKLDVDGGVRTRVYNEKIVGTNANNTTTAQLLKPTIPCDKTNRGEIRVFSVQEPLGLPVDMLCACMADSGGSTYSWYCYR